MITEINLAKELLANKGNSLVVSGSDNVSVQIIINAINNSISVASGTFGTVNISNGTITGVNSFTASTFLGDLIGDVSANNVKTNHLFIDETVIL